MTECNVTGCSNPTRTRGLCNAHHLRLIRYGDPLGGKGQMFLDPAEAFEARTRPDGECLIWEGSKDGAGYGQLRVRDRLVKAHRYAWEQAYGPVPDGRYVDHMCWNKACCRVEHLRLASHSENVRYQKGVRSDNSTGYRGVSRKRDSYVASVTKNGETRRVYGFATPEAAAEAASALRAEMFGQFAGRG